MKAIAKAAARGIQLTIMPFGLVIPWCVILGDDTRVLH